VEDIKKEDIAIVVPDSWYFSESSKALELTSLEQLTSYAIDNNQQLKQKELTLSATEQRLAESQSESWPEMSASLNTSRNKVGTKTYVNGSNLNLDFSYEIDLWGKISDLNKREALNFFSEKELFEQEKQQLTVDVVTAWLDILASKKLIALYDTRFNTAKQNVQVVERGHQLGLNTALDVYLIRNDLNSEKSRLINQKTAFANQTRVLERLLGMMPTGLLFFESDIPRWDQEVQSVLPSTLIENKPHLKAAWMQLLSANANLAYAHKQRFPSFNINASMGYSNSDITNLFDSSSLLWGVAGGITTPIFNAGRLKSEEEAVRFELARAEQTYIKQVYDAFAEVQNGLTSEIGIKETLKTAVEAEDNAIKAEDLSFEQYQKGLVTYTTVLVAQQRSLNTQSAVIELKKQFAVNRASLLLSLGGNQFSLLFRETK
jgi:NodT family efflux transporter outer membrane factor (OMF) lipoprotein